MNTPYSTTFSSLITKNERSLISPMVDFLALGGASLLFFLLAESFSIFTEPYILSFNHIFSWKMQYIVNFPHFAFSYLIFYQSYWNKLSNKESSMNIRFRYLSSGILIPGLLLLYSAYNIFHNNVLMLGYMANAMLF